MAEGGEGFNKQEYIIAREEHLQLLRGMPYPKLNARQKAIIEMERKERALEAVSGEVDAVPEATWRPLGPAPIPINANTAYSGRVSAIAVHPTNPNIVYVGTASGGLYRSLNGGTTWTPLMDSALSLAIGSVTISPTDPTTVWVGTGEATLCGTGCFIGVGLYRITDADTNPFLTGPLNRDAANNDVFTGRAMSRIVAHPTNSNILFVTTTSGVAGIGEQTTGFTLPNAGLYRTTNAMSPNPTFEKLTVQGTNNPNRSVVDAVAEPGNPSRLIVSVIGGNGDGGIYYTTNALDATPTFTRSLTTGDGGILGRAELAINKVGDVVTIYAATGTANGTLYRSVDGGATFNPAGGGTGFCGSQCFYDIAVAVDPIDASKVYLGGAPVRVFSRSTDSGATFTSNGANFTAGLHVDTHAFAVAPSNPNIVYFGSDGGIWKTMDVTATPIVWTTLNNTTFSATQFMSIALHPTDRNYLLGGTQDNGTQFLEANGTTWVQSDQGDGGFAVIDQNSTSTTNVIAYHTYFNQTNSQIGYIRATATEPNGDPIWSGFRGCSGNGTTGNSNNGIGCNDKVLFYAPMVRGPGTPNTLYFGTNKLYRSSDQGISMTAVSQTFTAGANERVSAIGIAAQNDDIRLAGTTTGRVYLSTTAGATTMTDITGSIPARYIGRIAIDPTNSDVAYVALNGFGLPNQHVWKTTNLLSGAPVWTPAGSGIPDVPTNTLAIDPADTQIIYAGTDIGVFRSINGGASWLPFSEGLPRIPVFGMEIHPVHQVVRIATHGRGIYEMSLRATRRAPADFDGDNKTDVSVFRPDGGNWYITNSSNSAFRGEAFGANGDIITPGDYDGDLKDDLAVFRGGNWYINGSQTGFRGLQFGIASDKPVAADYDGDGKTDVAVFRAGAWYISNSSNGQFRGVNWGLATDLPVPNDYDSDGKADIAVFRPTDGNWYVLKSSDNGLIAYQFGAPGDKPVPGDYDGDGKTDFAVFRPSNGAWYVQQTTAGFRGFGWGIATDIPVPGDYDGDGKFDFAVYRGGNWYISLNASGQFRATNFGLNTDVPAPAGYIPLQ